MFQFFKQIVDRIFSFNSTNNSQIDVISKNFNDTKMNILSKKVKVKVIKHQINVESVLEKQKAYLPPQIKNATNIGVIKLNTDATNHLVNESTSETNEATSNTNITTSETNLSLGNLTDPMALEVLTNSITSVYQTEVNLDHNLNYSLLQNSELIHLTTNANNLLTNTDNNSNISLSTPNEANHSLDLTIDNSTNMVLTTTNSSITNSNSSQELSSNNKDIELTDEVNSTNVNNLNNNVTEPKTNLFKIIEETNKPEINYKVNLNNQLGSSNCSVSNDVVAKLIVSKLHNDRVIDKDAKITITDSCTYNGNDIFINSDLTSPNIRLMDLLSPNSIHLNFYSDRVKGISVDVVNKQFAQCSIEVRNQILRLLMNRDRLGNQYISDDIVMLRCVINDDLFKSVSHLVLLKEPTVYNLKDNLKAQVIFYLFVASRDVKVFDQSLDIIIKKIKQLKENGNLFDNISSIENIWQEIASIDWQFEKKHSLEQEKNLANSNANQV